MAKAKSVIRTKFKEPVDLDRVGQFFLDVSRAEYKHYVMTWDGAILEVTSLLTQDSWEVPAANVLFVKKARPEAS